MNLFEMYVKIAIDTGEFEDGVDRAGKEADSLGDKLKNGLATAGKVVATGFAAITAAGGVLINTLLNIESSTEEYRAAMGKLNTAFEAAGHGAGIAEQAYRAFYGILGDTDTATEASQLLAKLADSAEDVSVWTDIAAGVAGTFGDALPIESLIEAANETAKVGQVTGTLADALNWAAISEEDFNAQLAACTSETERNDLIMRTLATTYDEASDAFYRNNEAVVAARDNQASLDASLSKIGDAVSNVKNAFVEQFTPAIETASSKISEFISGVDPVAIVEGIQSLIDKFVALVPVITAATAAIVAYKAASAISGIIDALKIATEGQTIAQAALHAVMNASPFVLVATLIAGLVTAVITLWNTNEEFRAAVEPIWEGIKSIFTSAWEGIKAVWDTVSPYFQEIWAGIQAVFSVVADVLGGYFSLAWSNIQTAWEVATNFFRTVWDTIAGIFAVVEAVLSGDFESAWEAIQDIVSGWGEFFSETWESIKGVFSDAWDVFSGIGGDIVNGIKQGINNAWGALKTWLETKFQNLVSSVKGALGISSPSKVFAGIGENMAQGVGVGWGNEFDHIRRDIENGMNFDTGTVDFAASGVGMASAGIINSVGGAAGGSGGGNITVNLVLPDGTALASYLLPNLANIAKANGTPILNPI